MPPRLPFLLLPDCHCRRLPPACRRNLPGSACLPRLVAPAGLPRTCRYAYRLHLPAHCLPAGSYRRHHHFHCLPPATAGRCPRRRPVIFLGPVLPHGSYLGTTTTYTTCTTACHLTTTCLPTTSHHHLPGLPPPAGSTATFLDRRPHLPHHLLFTYHWDTTPLQYTCLPACLPLHLPATCHHLPYLPACYTTCLGHFWLHLPATRHTVRYLLPLFTCLTCCCLPAAPPPAVLPPYRAYACCTAACRAFYAVRTFHLPVSAPAALCLQTPVPPALPPAPACCCSCHRTTPPYRADHYLPVTCLPLLPCLATAIPA